jgi:hypothetical protein
VATQANRSMKRTGEKILTGRQRLSASAYLSRCAAGSLGRAVYEV